MEIKEFKKSIGGKELIIKTGELTPQANGSVTVQYGDTLVLATAVMSKEPKEGIDYFPLIVDYEEKFYAAGKIKKSRFIKRESKPSEEAILTSRAIDRSIRPLFPKDMLNEVQVVVTVLSVDGENSADIPSVIAAATALGISDIPFLGPVASVRIGRIDGELVLNPTFDIRQKSNLSIILSATYDHIVMVEAGATEVPEEIILEAIDFGHKHIKEIIVLMKEAIKTLGKRKQEPFLDKVKPEIEADVAKLADERISEILFKQAKKERRDELARLEEEIVNNLTEKYEEEAHIKKAFFELTKKIVRQNILEKEKRIGGRRLDEVRPLSIKVGLLPRTHGSALFTRGETQVLAVVTLGAPGDEQILNEMEIEGKKRFLYHYNFPPFSTGEIQPLRGPGRREIGHGALAERALQFLIPSKESFSYTVRLVSEVLSSNGSTSMASVCAGSLALMDAGVPIKTGVSGVAMGLMLDQKKYKILTDIQDLEDFGGDMDFKVTGTKEGVTAIQMDVKTKKLTLPILREALNKAKEARLFILGEMNKVLPEPRKKMSPYAPRIISFKIDPDKIRNVIGPGGKVITEIIEETGVEIDVDDDGLISVTSTNAKEANKAIDWIEAIVKDVKVGEVFVGEVTKIVNFGAFVKILPNKEGLVHISELSDKRIRKVEDVLKVGDIISVKVIEINPQGKINLSLKAAKGKPEFNGKIEK